MVLKQLDRSESHRKTTSVTDVVEARFTDLALTWVFHAVDFVAHDPSCETSMIMRWAIAELDGGARVEITADHVPDVVPEEDQAAGLKSSLAKLAEHLAK